MPEQRHGSLRLDAPYSSGRVDTWIKSKCRAGHEVVIGGYTTTNGAFRSLIAGVYRDGKLVEVGRVGTGFGRDKVARILPKLQARWRPPRALFLAKPRREGWGNPLGAPGVGGGDRV
jgi:ATP-dependent DNA ligase